MELQWLLWSGLFWFLAKYQALWEWQAYAPYHVLMQLKRLVTSHCSCFSDENVWNDLWGFQSLFTRALTGLSRSWRQQVWQELWHLSCEKTKFAVQFYSTAAANSCACAWQSLHGSPGDAGVQRREWSSLHLGDGQFSLSPSQGGVSLTASESFQVGILAGPQDSPASSCCV